MSEPTAPIKELESILEAAGDDVKKLFGVALSSFAGPYAANQSYADKKAGLERVIRGN